MTLTVLHDATGRIVAAARHTSGVGAPRPVASHGAELVEFELTDELRAIPLEELCETHDIHALKRKAAVKS